ITILSVCRPSDRLDLDLSCSLDCPEWQSLHGRHFIGFPLCGSSLAAICSRLLVVFSWCRPALTALARLSPSLYPPQQLKRPQVTNTEQSETFLCPCFR